jgi:hypothetical protein
MQNRTVFLTSLAIVLLAYSALALATTRAQALAMPLGTWPKQLDCFHDDQGKPTGYRMEEIVVSDSSGKSSVLTRSFPDPTCLK